MDLYHTDRSQAKGWYAGHWNSKMNIALGFANQAIDEPHDHRRVDEIYLVARGEVSLHLKEEVVRLRSGDVTVIHPGEARTFTDATPDYLLFVVHTPGLSLEEMKVDKISLQHSAVK
jgi:mannose-6-phosphate isomerase-like protein (cupin superfamily)